MPSKLVEVAERYKTLQTTALAQPGDGAKVVALKDEAQKAIEAGDLARADALLAEVETEQRRMLDRLTVSTAETSARRGDIAFTRLRYPKLLGISQTRQRRFLRRVLIRTSTSIICEKRLTRSIIKARSSAITPRWL